QFFDQWVYHAHNPELEVSYSWDERAKLAKVSVRQTQKVSESVFLFDFPVTVRFKGQFGTADRAIHVSAKEEDFYFPLDSAPQIVRLDSGYMVLGTTTSNLPVPMLRAPLPDNQDALGRLLAIE